MLTLAVDTSSATASVALLEGERLRGEVFLAEPKEHSPVLLSLIDELLLRSRLKIQDIDLFVSTVGPGNFTGLRIGVSTIKGLGLAADRPVAGVSSLETLAMNLPFAGPALCPMLDARRGQIYSCLYEASRGGTIRPIAEEKVAAIEDILKNIEQETVFLGVSALAAREVITECLGEKARFLPEPYNYIKAQAAGLLGLRIHREGKALSPGELCPRYLRAPD